MEFEARNLALAMRAALRPQSPLQCQQLTQPDCSSDCEGALGGEKAKIGFLAYSTIAFALISRTDPQVRSTRT